MFVFLPTDLSVLLYLIVVAKSLFYYWHFDVINGLDFKTISFVHERLLRRAMHACMRN